MAADIPSYGRRGKRHRPRPGPRPRLPSCAPMIAAADPARVLSTPTLVALAVIVAVVSDGPSTAEGFSVPRRRPPDPPLVGLPREEVVEESGAWRATTALSMAPPPRAPIRKSGVFGLFDENGGGDSDSGRGARGGREREWPVRVVNATDGAAKVTIVDRDKGESGGGWDNASMKEQAADVLDLQAQVGEGGEDPVEEDDEERMEVVASMLVEPPPGLRPASLSPTRSIEEEYARTRAASDTDSKDSYSDGTKLEKSTPGESLMRKYESIDVSSSAVGESHEKEDEEDETEDSRNIMVDNDEANLEAQQPESIGMISSDVDEGGNVKVDAGEEGKESVENDHIIESTNTEEEEMLLEAQRELDEAEAMLRQAEGEAAMWEQKLADVQEAAAAAASWDAEGGALGERKTFVPTPPLAPPTQENIDQNLGVTSEILSVNRDLQPTLDKRREDSGAVRLQIDELDAGSSLQKESDRQLFEANQTIAALKVKAEELERQLTDGEIRLQEVREAKEGMAAEYSYAVNLYADLKRSAEARASEWSNKLEASRAEVALLHVELSNATKAMEKSRIESEGWKRESDEKDARLASFRSRAEEMEATVASLKDDLAGAEADRERRVAAVQEAERQRTKDDLIRMGEEYEALMATQSKRIGRLRCAVRGANSKKRLAERRAEGDAKVAAEVVRAELAAEVDELRDALQAREEEVQGLECVAREAEIAVEERERLRAEFMFMTGKIEELREELTSNAEAYEDCVGSFEREAAVKEKRIRVLEEELRIAEKRISVLELRIRELEVELERERDLNANLTSTVSEMRSDLDAAKANAGGYENIVTILRKEAEEYQTQLSGAKGETEFFQRRSADLEDLLAKTKDSLVEEKKLVAGALEERDAHIARLERDLAEKFDEAHTAKATLADAKSQLEVMTGKYNGENERADALDRKIEKLNQMTRDGQSPTGEVDHLTKLLEEVTKSKGEYESMVNAYETKADFMTQQLLLSEQNLSKKQDQITSLKRELSEALSKTEVMAETKGSTYDEVTSLKARLKEVQSKSTVFKAQANGMIIQLQQDLKDRDAALEELRGKLEEGPMEEQQTQSSSNSDGKDADTLEIQIADLKTALEEAQSKAKEKIKHKNQSLKEMEDAVAALKAEVEDLSREKNQFANRLSEEIRRGEDDFRSHEQQMRRMEERLAKEHLEAMADLEDEMNQSIIQLEEEIRTLKSKPRGEATAEVADTERRTLRDAQEALRRSKEKEVSLIGENARMQQRIRDLLQAQERKPSMVATDSLDDEGVGDDSFDGFKEGAKSAVQLPAYYKENSRPVIIRFVGNTWNRLFRRSKKI